MDTATIKEVSRQLIESAEAAYLTTIGSDGFPDTRAMLNLRNTTQYPGLAHFFSSLDPFQLYFSTNTSSSKVRQMQENPNVSVYYCQPKSFHGVMFGGKIEIIEDVSIKQALWQPGWEIYYPKGFDDPDHTVLRLSPLFLRGWYQLQRLELTF